MQSNLSTKIFPILHLNSFNTRIAGLGGLKLCQVLTDMEAFYPGTNMRLTYKTHALQFAKDLDVEDLDLP